MNKKFLAAALCLVALQAQAVPTTWNWPASGVFFPSNGALVTGSFVLDKATVPPTLSNVRITVTGSAFAGTYNFPGLVSSFAGNYYARFQSAAVATIGMKGLYLNITPLPDGGGSTLIDNPAIGMGVCNLLSGTLCANINQFAGASVFNGPVTFSVPTVSNVPALDHRGLLGLLLMMLVGGWWEWRRRWL